MLKRYDFECAKCTHVFEDLVEGADGQPDECPACASLGKFKKLPSLLNVPTTIVVDYPGSKRFKAGYLHSHGDRPAEKRESQVSMYTGRGKK